MKNYLKIKLLSFYIMNNQNYLGQQQKETF